MEASTLAIVFEERVMPRVKSSPVGGCEEVDAENDGGPEQLVSFEGLMTWPDMQVNLPFARGSGCFLFPLAIFFSYGCH